MSNLGVCVLLVASLTGGGVDLNVEIANRNDAIHAATNANQRSAEMRALVEVLSNADRRQVEQISDQSVGRVASLLQVDGVNGLLLGAKALYYIACRAKIALPKLQTALEDAKPVGSTNLQGLIFSPPVDARPDIHAAIRKIEGIPACP